MDYTLEVKVKNGLLLKRIHDAGFETITSFSRATDFGLLNLYAALNLKMSLYTKKLKVRRFPQRLADYFMCEPVDLFPEEIWLEPIKNNKSVKEINAEQMFLANSMRDNDYGSIEYIENEIDSESEVQTLFSKIKQNRRMEIVKSKIYEDKTFSEIGDDYGISGTRVQQIYNLGIREMRK